MEWDEWAKTYPATIVTEIPKDYICVYDDYRTAEIYRDAHELQNEVCCKVVQKDNLYYVIYSD